MGKKASKSTMTPHLIKTFTYFIPAPPARKTGYREIEFDKIFNGILSSGFEIKEIQTQNVTTGIFVIVILKARNKKVMNIDDKLDMQDNFKLSNYHSTPEIVLEDENEI